MDRQLVSMKDPVLAPGVAYTATATVTMFPAGQSCEAELFLGESDSSPVATSGRVSFQSNGSPQQVQFQVTMPSQYGEYHVYLDVFMGSIRVLAFLGTEDVIVPGGSVDSITWT